MDMQGWLSKQHCGYYRIPLDQLCLISHSVLFEALSYSPPVLQGRTDYTVDVKVHMLMPNQYPCIPNWHYDMVPRVDGEQDFSKVDTSQRMYLWVSNPPLTEFADGRIIKPKEWIEFTQLDLHRGTVSTEHCWRMFIRIAPVELVPPAPKKQWLRRHSQVYLDPNTFRW